MILRLFISIPWVLQAPVFVAAKGLRVSLFSFFFQSVFKLKQNKIIKSLSLD